jgi:hypothetical protein
MTMTRLARLIAATLTVSTIALCQLAPASAANSVRLRYTFKANQSHTYSAVIKVSVAFLKQKSSYSDKLTLTQRVAQAYLDGSATLQSSYSKSTLTSNGLVAPLNLKSIGMTQHVAQDGTVLATQTKGISQQNGLAYLASGVNTHPILPKMSVSMGQTWAMTQQVSLGHLGVFPLAQKFKLTGMKTQSSHRIAQIQVSGNQPVHLTKGPLSENGTIKSSGTIQFDTTGGVLVALHEQVQQSLTVTATGGVSKGRHATDTTIASVDVVKTS